MCQKAHLVLSRTGCLVLVLVFYRSNSILVIFVLHYGFALSQIFSSVVYIEHASNTNDLFLNFRYKLKRWTFPWVQEAWKSDIGADPWSNWRPLWISFLQTAGGSRESPYCIQRKALLWHAHRGYCLEWPWCVITLSFTELWETIFWCGNVTITASLLIDPFILFRNRERKWV